MVCGEDEGGLGVPVEIGEELLDLVRNLVNDLYVGHVLLPEAAVSVTDCSKERSYCRMRTVRVTRRVEAEQVEKEDCLLPVEGSV